MIGPGSFQPYTPPTFGPGSGQGGQGRGRYPPGVPPPGLFFCCLFPTKAIVLFFFLKKKILIVLVLIGARFDPFTPFDPNGRRGFDPDPDNERPPHHDDFYS